MLRQEGEEMVVECWPRLRRYPGTTLLVSLFLCMGMLSLLTGCVIEPHYVPYIARLLPANEHAQQRQDERAIETKEGTAAYPEPEASPEVQPGSRLPPYFWVVPPIASRPPAVEHGQPYDYEHAIDTQEQVYRQQRSVQEQEQRRASSRRKRSDCGGMIRVSNDNGCDRLFSQMLTLSTTPVVYLYLDHVQRWCTRLRQGRQQPALRGAR
jgi:hypothetical protein